MLKTVVLALVAHLTLSHMHFPEEGHAEGLPKKFVHKCIHDELSKKLKPTVMPEGPAHSHLQAPQVITYTKGGYKAYHKQATILNIIDGWHKIRIYLDFSYANSFVGSNTGLQAAYQVSARHMQNVRKYFQSVLQVNYYVYMSFRGGYCPNRYISPVTLGADLFIAIQPENDPSTAYFAAAQTCYLSGRDLRPTMGAYYLNFAFIKTTPLYEYVYFSTFAHEFTHILGFSSDNFRNYRNSNGVIYGLSKVVGRTTISGPQGSQVFNVFMLPEVRDFARAYYNCPTLMGLPLENNGGSGSAGSHWEKLFNPIEYMNPQVEYPAVISNFTMALLRSSGWYKTTPDAAQRYDWGRGAGCAHFRICPTTQPGYCSSTFDRQAYCTSEYMSKGICYPDTYFSSGCRIQLTMASSCLIDTGATRYPGEAYGPNSRCLLWTASSSARPKCQRVTCNSDGSLSVIYSSTQTLRCTSNFQVIAVSGESYRLNCPNITDFCSEYNARCLNDCNAKGICLTNRTCSCFDGYSGADCSSFTSVSATRFPLLGIQHLQQEINQTVSKGAFIFAGPLLVLLLSLIFEL